MNNTRFANVYGKGWSGSTLADGVAAGLPENYTVYDPVPRDGDFGTYVRIGGTDVAGWTLDDYVAPRLATLNYYVVETCAVGICRDVAVVRLRNEGTGSVWAMCGPHRSGFERRPFVVEAEMAS